MPCRVALGLSCPPTDLTHYSENAFVTPLDHLIDALLDRKALPPRDPSTARDLTRIMRLDISSFNETEVRCEIIDPLIKILGYDIENWASLKRERAVRVAGASKSLDYSMLLFEENFWVIEAKRPGPATGFDREDVYQALRYAAHPEINAALMMLCDGNKLEVYDREVSLDEPLLSVPRAKWAEEFDTVRALLSPWQAYFFERRRIERLVDKLFDQETHLERLEEFRRKLDHKLIDKRARIVLNWRERVDIDGDFDAHRKRLATADPVDLVETDFFVQHDARSTTAMISNVAATSDGPGQLLSYRIFPEAPRATSVAFWGHGLSYLLKTLEIGQEELLLPSWLGGGSVRTAIERLIPKLLTCFAGDQDRMVTLLHSVATRRLLKLHLLIDRAGRRSGEVLHALERFYAPELSFAQSVSSPSRHLLGLVEGRSLAASAEFVRIHSEGTRSFRGATAKQSLQDLWRTERAVLDSLPDYRVLLRETKLDDLHWFESYQVWYDALGHLALVILDGYPEWKEWALKCHFRNVVELARNGSWQARDWLGLERDANMEPLPGEWAPDRFFLGDSETAEALTAAYRNRSG